MELAALATLQVPYKSNCWLMVLFQEEDPSEAPVAVLLYGSRVPPGPGPVAPAAVLMPAGDSQNPMKLKLAVDPGVWSVAMIRKYHGMLVWATMFRGKAPLEIVAVPPKATSNVKVPGEVTRVLMIPEASNKRMSPTCLNFPGFSVGRAT